MNDTQLVTAPRVLVAIDASPSGSELPSDFSGFLNPALNDGELKLNPSTGSGPDSIFNIEGIAYPILGYNTRDAHQGRRGTRHYL